VPTIIASWKGLCRMGKIARFTVPGVLKLWTKFCRTLPMGA
jgi:hypothetical protein